MKHLFLIAGTAVLVYAWSKQRAETSTSVAGAATGDSFNAGVANTSSGGAAANIGASTGAGMQTILPVSPGSASPAAIMSVSWGGGSAAHPLDF